MKKLCVLMVVASLMTACAVTGGAADATELIINISTTWTALPTAGTTADVAFPEETTTKSIAKNILGAVGDIINDDIDNLTKTTAPTTVADTWAPKSKKSIFATEEKETAEELEEEEEEYSAKSGKSAKKYTKASAADTAEEADSEADAETEEITDVAPEETATVAEEETDEFAEEVVDEAEQQSYHSKLVLGFTAAVAVLTIAVGFIIFTLKKKPQ